LGLSFGEQLKPEPEPQHESESEPVVENLSGHIATAIAVALALEDAMGTDDDSNCNGKRGRRDTFDTTDIGRKGIGKHESSFIAGMRGSGGGQEGVIGDGDHGRGVDGVVEMRVTAGGI
jgi:hypothetical protein